MHGPLVDKEYNKYETLFLFSLFGQFQPYLATLLKDSFLRNLLMWGHNPFLVLLLF